MKHLRLFESILTESDLRRLIDDYSELRELSKEYLFLHKDELLGSTLIDEIEEISYVDPKNYFNKKIFPEPPILGIHYNTEDDEGGNYFLNNKKYKDFLSFLKDPELYKSTKKYNL